MYENDDLMRRWKKHPDEFYEEFYGVKFKWYQRIWFRFIVRIVKWKNMAGFVPDAEK